MNTLVDNKINSTLKWWWSKLPLYNAGLIVSGIVAFVLYVTVLTIYIDSLNDVEVTIFTTAFQAFGYLFMMVIANVCFHLGPIVETLVSPVNVDTFRKRLFALGFWFSVALPFSIPASLLIMAIYFPEQPLGDFP